MQEAMSEVTYPSFVWAGLVTLALYGLGLGLAVAVLISFISFIITRFNQHRNNGEVYIVLVLAVSGATIGLLIGLPVATAILYFTDVSQKCNHSLCDVLRGSSLQTVRAAPSLGAIVAVIGYWRS
jgi:MFS family permease